MILSRAHTFVTDETALGDPPFATRFGNRSPRPLGGSCLGRMSRGYN
jgi:hypothetical protein